ncbi:hypothetical protein ABVT39_014157 [Epinephelus coioides]
MATPEEVILKTLENLGDKDFKKFKWYLKQKVLEGYPVIPICRLEKADRMNTVDEMVQTYTMNAIKVTRIILRKMDRNELVENLPKPVSEPEESLPSECQQKLKSNFKNKFQCVFEGIAKAGNPTLLNQIYTELYITEGGTAEVNDEREVRQIETASRKPDRPETTIRQEDIFKASPGRDEPIRTVMTKGVAGIGKTVLTQKFTLDWAEDKDIKEERGLYQDEVFCFVHLSVQEFLAALHVHLTFINSGVNLMEEAMQRSTLTRLHQSAVDKALQSPNGHLDLFLRFLLGLSLQTNQNLLEGLLRQTGSSSQTNQETVQYIKKKINQDLSAERSINLFHCLNELNDRSLVEEIQQSLSSGHLSTDELSPAQWSALVFILLSSEEDLDVFDLKKYSASEEALVRLLPVVKASNKALLADCNLSERSCEALYSVLSSQSSSLRHLDLSNNDLQDSGVKLLSDGLKSSHCKLEILSLSGCLITEEGCVSLASALSSNHPGDSGVKLQSAGLKDPLRSFPEFLRGGRKRPSTSGFGSLVSKRPKIWKPFDIHFFLLSSNEELTPLLSDELAFMQAGLGRRTVSLNSDVTYVKLSRILQATYPKMVELQNRWLFYKARGGNGRRKMSAIPFEAEGYTGAMLRNISDGGKRTLYIVPLQDKLDLSPLPANAPEFALMPKASCKHCSVEMPVQMLVLHDQKCASQMISDDDNKKFSEFLQTPVPVQTEEDHCPQQEEDVQCPICSNIFPVLLIEERVSHCGQRTKDTTSPERELHTAMDDISCEEDVVMWLKAKVDSSKTFELCVSRDNMFERGLKMWKRKQKATPLNPLRMKFLGEAGIDTGALRKEFLTTMVSGIEQRLFEGGKSKMPKYSVNDFAEELFRTAGEIFATSIAQGGPAPRFLQPWCYEFLASGKLSLDHVLGLSPLIAIVAKASDLTDYTADILDCGYTGKIDMEHKENILITIDLHVMRKRKPMLQQLREGLDIYGFSQVMQAKTEECRSLFVAGDDESGSTVVLPSKYQVSEAAAHHDPKYVRIPLGSHNWAATPEGG